MEAQKLSNINGDACIFFVMKISISSTIDRIVETVHTLKTDKPLAPVTIIVPNSSIIQSVNRTLLTWETPVLNVRIETLGKHIERLTESVRLKCGRPLLLNEETHFFIREIIDSDELSYFKAAGQFANYTAFFQRTIKDLRLGLPVSTVSIALDTLGQNGKELARIYRKYLIVKGRRIDYADMLELYTSCDEILILFPGVADLLTYAESTAIRRNHDNIITVDYQPCLISPAARLTSSIYRTFEIRDVFREIIQLKAPCDRIAIVAPHDYLTYVAEEADQLGIPLFCPMGEENTSHQAHAFIALLEIIESDYDFQKLKRYFQLQRDFASLDALFKCGVARGYTTLQNKLAHLSKGNQPKDILKLKQIIEDIAKIQTLQETPHEMGRSILNRFICKSYQKNMIRNALENLAHRHSEISYLTWKTVIAEQITSIRHIKTETPNAILLTTEHLPGVFDYLFFLFLQEEHIPPKYREDPILPDTSRKAINTLTGGGLLTAKEQNQRAIRNIKLITACADKAWFGYFHSTDTLTGNKLFPSFHLTNFVKEMAEQTSVSENAYTTPLLKSWSSWVADTPEQCIDQYEWHLYHLFNQTTGFVNHCMAISESAQKHLGVINSHLNGSFDEYSGFIAMDGRKQPGKSSCFTASELQVFMTCPFQWFIAQRLGIRPSTEPVISDTPAATLIDTILHLTLKTYLQDHNLSSGKPIEIISDEIVDRQIAYANGVAPLYVEKLKQDMATMTQYFLAHLKKCIRGDRKHGVTYLAFGNNCQHDAIKDPVSVSIGGCTFTLKGVIDRIDIADDIAFIIDYKASKARNYRDIGFHQGQRLQPALHAEVSRAIIKRHLLKHVSDIKTIYSGYLPLKDNADEFLAIYDLAAQSELQKIIVFIFEAMHQGFFFTTGNCDQCHYATICGPDVALSSRIKMENALKDETLNQLSETYKQFKDI